VTLASEVQKVTIPLATHKLSNKRGKPSLPKFYRWRGGSLPFCWSFGWETGKDNDLVCIKPHVRTGIEGKIALSPVCSSRFLAFCGFMMKAILVTIDHNLKGLEG